MRVIQLARWSRDRRTQMAASFQCVAMGSLGCSTMRTSACNNTDSVFGPCLIHSHEWNRFLLGAFLVQMPIVNSRKWHRFHFGFILWLGCCANMNKNIQHGASVHAFLEEPYSIDYSRKWNWFGVRILIGLRQDGPGSVWLMNWLMWLVHVCKEWPQAANMLAGDNRR